MVVRIAGFLTVAIYVGFALLLLFTVRDGADPAGSPVGYDFSAYYEAAQFARHGEAARAYDDTTLFAAEKSRFPSSTTELPWNYPPIFQALLLPLAMLPYFVALAAWTLGLFAAHAAFTRRVASSHALWPLLIFPGAGINLMLGANGLLVALFVGAGLVVLDRKPRLAGVLFALALFKPHLALLTPIALLAGRRYQALVAMIAAAVALAIVTTVVIGPAAWPAFFAKATHAEGIATASSSGWTRVPTIFTLAQVIGLGKTLAGVLHALVALGATCAVVWIWRSNTTSTRKHAALALGLLIVTPYARIYDFALLLLPILALLDDVRARQAFEDRALVVAAWIAPFVGLFVKASTPWLSVLIVVLLVQLSRNVARDAAETRRDPLASSPARPS